MANAFKGPQHTIECEFCGDQFSVRESRKDSAKYCSRDCKAHRVDFFGKPLLQQCRRCEKIYAVEEISNDSHHRLCSDCYLEHERDRYQNDKQRYQEEGYEIPESKKCIDCGQKLPTEAFSKDAGSLDKHAGKCKSCQSEYYQGYRARNRERLLNYHEEWRQENDPSNKWAVERRKRQSEADGWYDLSDVIRQWHRQNGRCFWCGGRCGTKPKHHNEYHVDHLHPLNGNGTNWPRNLVIACPDCNRSKSDKLPIEFKRYHMKYLNAESTYHYGSTVPAAD